MPRIVTEDEFETIQTGKRVITEDQFNDVSFEFKPENEVVNRDIFSRENRMVTLPKFQEEAVAKPVIRASLGIESGIGAMTQWLGEVTSSIGRTRKNLVHRFFPKPLPKLDYGPSISQEKQTFEQAVGNRLAALGKDSMEFWQKASKADGVAPDSQIFAGTFMQNPSFTRGVATIMEAVPSLAAATAITFVTKNPTVGAATLGLMDGSQTYIEARQAGKSVGESTTYGALSTVGSTILEILPLTRFLEGGESKLVKDIFIGAIQEGGEEALQTGWSNFISKVGYDDTRALTQGMVEAFLAGAGSGGILGGLTSGYADRMDAVIDRAKAKGATDSEISLINDSIVNQIVSNKDKIEEILALPAPDKVYGPEGSGQFAMAESKKGMKPFTPAPHNISKKDFVRMRVGENGTPEQKRQAVLEHKKYIREALNKGINALNNEYDDLNQLRKTLGMKQQRKAMKKLSFEEQQGFISKMAQKPAETPQISTQKKGVQTPETTTEPMQTATPGEALDPLIEEARKYKSAEEFINSRKILYHGTDKNFEVFDAKLLGKYTGAESAKEGFFFTDNKRNAEMYAGIKESEYNKYSDEYKHTLDKIANIVNIKKVNKEFNMYNLGNAINEMDSEILREERLVLEEFSKATNWEADTIEELASFTPNTDAEKAIFDKAKGIINKAKFLESKYAEYKNLKNNLFELGTLLDSINLKKDVYAKEKGIEDKLEGWGRTFFEAKGVEPNVKEVSLDIKNPYEYTEPLDTSTIEGISSKKTISEIVEYAKENGYDSAIIKGKDDPLKGTIYVVFSPDQIKTKSQLTDIWNRAQGKPATIAPQSVRVSQPGTAGETKISGIASSVAAKAIEKKLSDGFRGLSEYETINIKDQAQKSAELITSDYAKAKRIAMGEEEAPQGLKAFAVRVAVEDKAFKEGDVATIRDLATKSLLNRESSESAQTLRLLAERDPENPTTAIADVAKIRENASAKRNKVKDIKKKKKSEVKSVKESINKSLPDKTAWQSFIEEIQC